MREIKFRAWDSKNKKMLMSSIIWGSTHLELPDIKYEKWSESDHADYINAHLMQYTGLKDKNGKEIYEGDIVLNNDYTWTVDWKEGCVYLVNAKDRGEWWIGTEHEHCEIIGNIYENPELLTDTQKVA